mmetsp:Transcript_13096/g.21210  ORF Transcript_13096/g.21210 Transcript_13096/m.21210 type:complete len:376 (+) Transcript_13096:53-1180(+)
MDYAASWPFFRDLLWSPKAQGTRSFHRAREDGAYPMVSDLQYLVPVVALFYLGVKFLLDTCVFNRVCKRFLRLKEQPLPFDSPRLEKIYVEHKPHLPDINEIKAFSKELGKSVEDLNKWFRFRQVRDRQAVKVRVCSESMWRLLMYGVCVVMNLQIIRSQAWAKDITKCWEDVPFQLNDPVVKLFYVGVEIPLYMCLLFLQVWDNRKAKDRWEMTTHHALVLLLISLVYVGNFVRIGMVGLLLHDITDIFLETSKLASSFRYKGLSDLMFAGFGISWGYCRLYLFSTLIIRSIFSDGKQVIGFGFNFLVGLIFVLYLLNLYWFKKIAFLMYRLFWAGAEKERQQRDFTDLSTDDDIDSDSSYLSESFEPIKKHED